MITARIDNVVKSIETSLPTQTTEPPFSIRIVRTGTAGLDGTDIPDTPGGSLRLLYRPQGIAYADSADLDSAAFSDALHMAFKSAYSDQIHRAVATVVEKYFDCHPLMPKGEVQPWETVWRPPDEYKLLADQQIMPVLQIPNLVKQLNIGLAPAVVAAQPDTSPTRNPMRPLLRKRWSRCASSLSMSTPLKSRMETLLPMAMARRNLSRSGARLPMAPSMPSFPPPAPSFSSKALMPANFLKSITFERLPAGPVLIALQPYPAATLPRLEFDVTVPGLNVLDISYAPSVNGQGTSPIRTFGQLFSFKDFPVPLTFGGDDLAIHAIVNDGYAGVQVPLSAVKMTLYPAGSNTGVPLAVKQEGFGSDPCKSVPRVRFVGTVRDAGRALPPGRHTVVVEINDGIDNINHRLVLSYQSPPDYFDDCHS